MTAVSHEQSAAVSGLFISHLLPAATVDWDAAMQARSCPNQILIHLPKQHRAQVAPQEHLKRQTMLIPAVQNVPSVLTVLMVHRALLVAQGNTMTLRVSMYVRTVLLDLRPLERVVLHKVLPVQLRIPKSVSHVLPVKRPLKLLLNAQRVVLVNPVSVVLVVTMSVLNALPELLPLPFRQLV